MSMTVIVVGCGRVGAELANRLHARGTWVVVVDRDADAFNRLPPDFRGRFVEGDVLSEDVLLRCGIEQADGLAAVTPSDAVNAVVGHVARSVHNIPYVVVRNYDPRWRKMIEAFGLPVVSSSRWGAQRMEELLGPRTVRSVFSAGDGGVEFYEITLPETWAGHPLCDLVVPGASSVGALTRAGRAMMPAPGTLLEAGDVLHISATPDGIGALNRRLGLE
jgi:trk system potassium uptake protein TrkA